MSNSKRAWAMKAVSVLLFSAITGGLSLILGGCGKNDSNSSTASSAALQTFTAFAGSCSSASMGVCAEFSYSASSASDPRSLIETNLASTCASIGPYSSGRACDRTAMTGVCSLPTATQSGPTSLGTITVSLTQKIIFRSPMTETSARTSCGAAPGGTFSVN